MLVCDGAVVGRASTPPGRPETPGTRRVLQALSLTALGMVWGSTAGRVCHQLTRMFHRDVSAVSAVQ